ncbi:hypothetical protein [Pseudonocardia sp. N23]|uniref:hypothetical protein n=1 Tax=Pseudonocardia sp. N23 TaxID=1987376 RepID=UPI000BFCF84F|nr:hypothetical protein [Pseudonocardia sp. N23]GAY10574.1 hypothetical protein TOK_4935 [Pseudonocardia sp. N23]
MPEPTPAERPSDPPEPPDPSDSPDSPDSAGTTGARERFGWEGGAPGYSVVDPDRLAPHQPMPGAPPYPAAEELPPPPVGERATGTGPGRPLLAAAVWGVVDLVLVFVVAGAPPSTSSVVLLLLVIVAAVLVAGLLTWLVARRRRWPSWALFLVAGLAFWVVRAATTAGVG